MEYLSWHSMRISFVSLFVLSVACWPVQKDVKSRFVLSYRLTVGMPRVQIIWSVVVGTFNVLSYIGKSNIPELLLHRLSPMPSNRVPFQALSIREQNL